MNNLDGSWLDKSWACRVCGGEIPHGHSDSCDVYKMEMQIRDYEEVQKSTRVLIKEIDTIISAPNESAKQASLCDIVSSVKELVKDNAELRDSLSAALGQAEEARVHIKKLLSEIKNSGLHETTLQRSAMFFLSSTTVTPSSSCVALRRETVEEVRDVINMILDVDTLGPDELSAKYPDWAITEQPKVGLAKLRELLSVLPSVEGK